MFNCYTGSALVRTAGYGSAINKCGKCERGLYCSVAEPEPPKSGLFLLKKNFLINKVSKSAKKWISTAILL